MSEPLTINAPVVEVTLLEDRARVIRRGKTNLPAGVITLRVTDVSPVICDKTLIATASSKSALNVCVHRAERILESSKPADIRQIDEQIEALQNELKKLDAQKLQLTSELELAGTLVAQTLGEFSEDASWGKQPGELWRAQFEQLTANEHAFREAIRKIQFDAEEPSKKVADLQRQRTAALTPATALHCAIEAQFNLAEAGEYEVQFDYVVPGACWRPYHTARLSAFPKPHINFECDGCVWQNTGEDWRDVTLNFSTQRSSMGAEPPRLKSDILSVQKKQQIVVAETREQEVFTAGLGAGVVAGKKSLEMPGIDDGGQTLHLKGRYTANIPSDGRPCRVNIFAFEAECRMEYVLMPELSRCVFLKTLHANDSAFPILAGPVDLIRDSGLNGRTSVLFIASGEEFFLSWGPENALRASREHNVLDPESGMLSSWISKEHRVAIQISNLGSEEKTIKVSERIPVSELEKVQITPNPEHTSANVRPDENGFMKWETKVGAFGRETIRLRYTIKKHKDVAGV